MYLPPHVYPARLEVDYAFCPIPCPSPIVIIPHHWHTIYAPICPFPHSFQLLIVTFRCCSFEFPFLQLNVLKFQFPLQATMLHMATISYMEDII